jgi:hypothetical protein
MTPTMTALAGSVGVGFRKEIAADLLNDPRAVDFVEVVAESAFAQSPARREAIAIAEVWPVVPHGVKLSLGSAEGIDVDRARRLGKLTRELRAPFVSEHLAFVRAGGVEIGHLTGTPFTRAAVDVVARNVDRARRHLPDVPLYLENAAWGFRYAEDEMSEGEFHHRIVERTGCDLLLDVANVYANACNANVDPAALLRSYPLDRLGMVHAAGGMCEEGFVFDSHADPIDPAVVAMAHEARARSGRRVPVLLERDDNFPPFAELAAEIASLRDEASRTPSDGPYGTQRERRPASPCVQMTNETLGTLVDVQSAVAHALTTPASPRPALPGIDSAAIDRARGILMRKRIDEAWPLFPSLARVSNGGCSVQSFAASVLARAARASSHHAVADAFAVLDAASLDPALSAAALADRIALEARYVRTRSGVRPRVAPFARRVTLGDDRVVWMYKGIGAHAVVRRTRETRASAWIK